MRRFPAGGVLAVLAALGAAAPAWGVSPAGLQRHGPDPASIDRLPELRVSSMVPTAWCGIAQAQDDVANEVPNGTHKFHAVYAVPSDGVDRFTLLAPTLQTDAFQASALLERLYGRAIRFDMGTSCGPRYLDISSVRLASSNAQLAAAAAATPSRVFDVVLADIRAAGFAVPPETGERMGLTRNFLIWLDGPSPKNVCGEAEYSDDPTRAAENWNNVGGRLALIYKVNGQFCRSNTVRHELGHNLGALQPGAPHAFDGAHCDDAYEDTMCYSVAPRRASGEANALFFDYGHDDYWDPPGGALPGWAVNLSKFLCSDAHCNLTADSTPDPAIDDDGDSLPNSIDSCPNTPGTSCAATADSTRPTGSVARARVERRKVGRHRWKVRVRVRGRGRARVRIVCGRRTVRRRTVRVPKTLRFKVRCAKRIRVRTRPLRPTERR